MSDRRRVISFEEETAERGESLMRPVTYKGIMGPEPCVRTMTWDFEDGSFADLGKEIRRSIWTTMPDNLTDTWYVVESEHPLIAQARIQTNLGALIKLWHDDVREPPDDSWLWARDNADAMAVLMSEFDVGILSMDHDLGGSDIPLDTLKLYQPGGNDYAAIVGDETGVELAEFIGKHDLFPQQIIIHSMNPVGAGNILAAFQKWSGRSERNCLIRIEPFRR